jgi:hypothetical protein
MMDTTDDAIMTACPEATERDDREPSRDNSANPAKPHEARDESADARQAGSHEEDPQVADLSLSGRFLREDRSEHECTALEAALQRFLLKCESLPRAQEHVVVYLEEIGRLEGHVEETDEEESTFVLKPVYTPKRREKVAQTLRWLRDRQEGRARERRRHLRIQPTDGQSSITLSDGRRYPCEVLDISLSGASVRMDVLPAVGTYVTLGRMRGRVVRHHESGIAIEFVRVADPQNLRNTVRDL